MRGRLVVEWVTISEHRLLYVFFFKFLQLLFKKKLLLLSYGCFQQASHMRPYPLEYTGSRQTFVSHGPCYSILVTCTSMKIEPVLLLLSKERMPRFLSIQKTGLILVERKIQDLLG
ncbi:hypothetical protein HDV63DRAFT_49920 [Trichoderma sp. SZMC 28014]